MENHENEKSHGKKIVILIIILAILLFMITSCSFTSNFFGKLGSSLSDSIDGIFKREDDIDIDDDIDDIETVTNQELQFDYSDIQMSLDDTDVKISFNYKKIKPNKFTCQTSDASIATCYVSNGYVVVNPKKAGNVKVILQSDINGKIYEATSMISIKDTIKSINLSSNGGIINLSETSKKYIPYSLTGLQGNIEVKSSNNRVAVASIDDNNLIITAKKAGKATITISINYNGKEYKDSYNLTIVDIKKENNNTNVDNNNDGEVDNNSNTDNNGNTSENNNEDNSDTTDNGENSGSIDKDNPSDTDENNDLYLNNISILNGKYKLNRNFDKRITNYSITTTYDEERLSLYVQPNNQNSTISYKLNGQYITNLNNLKLQDGDNVLEIILKSKLGKANTYKVNIRKPIRTIYFEQAIYTLYTNNVYNINYYLEEDGKKIDDYDTKDIKVSLDNHNDIIKINKGYVTIKPTDDMVRQNYYLEISYNGKNSKTLIEVVDNYLYTYTNLYEIGFNNNYGTGNIILNTNLFKNKNFNVQKNNKNITIKSNDNSIISLDLDNNMDLEYIGRYSNVTSLPFKVTANSLGKHVVHVTGKMSDKVIKKFDIVINAVPKYVVTLNANGGLFNEVTDEYQFLLSADESLDLSQYEEPYKVNKSECSISKFEGYSKEIDGSIIYDRDNNKIISNLNDNLTLYAKYQDTRPLEEKSIKRTLWLKDKSLFYNEEYYKEYGEAKIIYPGSNGTYIMHFKNKTSDKIALSGLTLKEQNICVDKGCINMGYIIKYSDSDDDDWTYYYGNKNSEYWVLNKNEKTVKLPNDNFKTHIDFKDKIIMDKNEEVVISLFWKWIEVNDEVDTLIGNKVSKNDSSINDMYGLSVGLDFETELVCD